MPPRSIRLPSGAPLAVETDATYDAPVPLSVEVDRPRYSVATDRPFYDGVALYQLGDEVFHDAEPGPNLQPLNDAATEAHAPVMKRLGDDPMAQSKPVGMLAYAGAQEPSAAAQIAELKARIAALEKSPA